MTADQAHAQMDPGVAGFDAVLTNVLIGFGHVDLVEMSALSSHKKSSFRCV